MEYFISGLQLTLGCIVGTLFAFCVVWSFLWAVGAVWNLIEDIRWEIHELKNNHEIKRRMD